MFHIQQLRAFSKTNKFLSLGKFDNLLSKQIAANAEFSGCKNGEPVQNTLENDIKDPEPDILTTLETENTPIDDLLLLSTPESEKFTLNKIHYLGNRPRKIFHWHNKKN